MNDHPAGRPLDRDLTSPVDLALATSLARAGDELGEVPADVARAHLDAITALAATHAHQAPAQAPAPGWRVRMRRVAGLTAVKVALGVGVAAAATTGGLAATGNLPDPVQQVVSDGARRVGIQIPQPSVPVPSEDETVHEGVDQETGDVPPATPVTPLDDPGQDVGDVPEQPVSDRSEQTDPPLDPDPGSPPVAPAENDPAPTPRPRPEPEPTPGQQRPTPAPEASPTPRSPAQAPVAPDAEDDAGHDDGEAPEDASGGTPSGDVDGGRAPAAG